MSHALHATDDRVSCAPLSSFTSQEGGSGGGGGSFTRASDLLVARARRTAEPVGVRSASRGRAASSQTRTRTRKPVATTRTTSRKRARREDVDERVIGDGAAADYRWFTVRGRRQLCYGGRTYKGRAAHHMWRQLKQRGAAASHAGGTGGRRSATRTRAGTATFTSTVSDESASVKTVFSSARSARDGRGVRDVNTGRSHAAANAVPPSRSRARAVAATPPAPLPVKMARVAPIRPPPPLFAPVMDVSDPSEQEEDVRAGHSDTESDNASHGVGEAKGSANETMSDTESWDSSSSSRISSMSSSTSITSGVDTPVTNTRDMTKRLSHDRAYAGLPLSHEAVWDESLGAAVRRVDDQLVVEQEGWVYPVEVFRAMRATALPETIKATATAAAPNACRSAPTPPAATPRLPVNKPPLRGGLTVMWGGVRTGGGTSAGARDGAVVGEPCAGAVRSATIVSHEGERMLSSMVPTRYTDDANMFDGFDPQEMAGLLDVGEEIGGVRFAG